MTNYFSHDYDAQTDIKLQNLIMKMGYEALGRYWCIVEMLYKQEGRIELDQCDSIAFALRTDSDNIRQIISLVFSTDDKYFWSETILKRLKIQKEKSNKAQKSAKKRWENEPNTSNAIINANAMRTHSERNANKEKKIKEKENKESKKKRAIAYFENLPEEDVKGFLENIEISPRQLQDKALELLNYCKMHDKWYDDNKAFMWNALKKDFKIRTPGYSYGAKPNDVLPELTPEEKARAEKVKENIRKNVLPRTAMEGGVK